MGYNVKYNAKSAFFKFSKHLNLFTIYIYLALQISAISVVELYFNYVFFTLINPVQDPGKPESPNVKSS